MNNKTHFRIPVDNNSSVHSMLWKSKSEHPKATIIFSHGFSVAGFESRRMFLEIGSLLTEQGYSVLLFDYRGSGYSDFDFSEMTSDTEIEDLNRVLDFCKTNNLIQGKLILWGQSSGAGVASIVATERKEISGLILWCLSADWYTRYRERLGSDLIKNGFIYTDKGFKVDVKFLESLKNKNIISNYHQVDCPILFVHGDADPVASVNLSLDGFKNANEPKTIEIIKGGIHGFKNQIPLYQEALKKTFDWLKNCTE